MIDAKRAVEIAKEKAAEMLGKSALNLEELEREPYRDRDVWAVTLSFQPFDPLAPITRIVVPPLEYKRFLIDTESGDLIAMKLREVASR